MENILKYIKAVQNDAGNVRFQSPVTSNRLFGKDVEGVRYQNPITAIGPQNFEGMIVQDFQNRAKRLQTAQDLSIQRNTQKIMDDDDARASVLQALNKQLSANYTKDQAAQDYAQSGLGRRTDSFRGRMIQGNQWAANNPQVVIPAGVGAATLGTTALLTASGQALAQLTNNMNQSLATEANRENVLTS